MESVLKCIKCELEKPLNIDNFSWRNDSQKWNNLCKNCLSIKNENYRKTHKNHYTSYLKIYYEKNKDTLLEYQKQYAKKNIEKISVRNKKHYQINKEKILAAIKTYNQLNKTRTSKQKIKYERDRKKNDPVFRFRKIISSSVRKYLKKSSKNNNSIINYLNINNIKFHIEKLFSHPVNLTSDGKIWMTWDNQGTYNKNTWNDQDPTTWTWQLDHIIPQSDLPYTSMLDENFKKCWSLDNLRPYSAKQNVLDGICRIRHLK